ncbi:zinc finger protein 436-like [Leptopilina boulardi]|uniref:zinc finger protein 436-like n=1 Tax=Leptopilina boulardi TaxID=63433 RepID=UPI0021F54809|nr:zinc finger protein 436-like [Leptopilina boulardi]
MTNEQNDVGQISEQSQEEIVQLTELLPVEQYRIQESSNYNDSGATDALKALRSFSQNEQEFFYQKYNELESLNGTEDYGDKIWNSDDEEEELLEKTNTKRGKKINIKKTDEKSNKEEEEIVLSEDSNFPNETIEDEIYSFQHDSEVENLEKKIGSNNLRKKIDAIIQANILLEQENENNNVMQEAKNQDNKEVKKYVCVICNSQFKGSGGLRNHYKVAHATGPLYKCDECGKEFPLKERLKLHVRTHTGFKPYKCLECDKSFARGGQLVQHRRTHSQVKPYHCSLCSGTFTCAANLTLHMKRHNGQKDHKCEICGRGFVRRDALKKHMECLHHDVKSFLCVICNKTLKGHLPQHMRTHAQDRPHGCGTCGQRFAQKSQLTVHQRTHSGQRPFRCLVCWQAFAHSTALKLHTRRHTGERPFKCEECNAGFTQLPHWKKHMKCIHGRNEPYCCRRCKSFFRIKSELESHQKFCKLTGKINATDNDDKNDKNIDNNVDDDDDDGDNDDQVEVFSDRIKYRVMPIEKMRLLLAVLLKRISKQEKLDELGFGKRLIDEVLHDSLISAGKVPVKRNNSTSEFDCLKKNVEIFLEWTVPKSHWAKFKKMKKTPEEILETLTTSAND